MNLNQLKYFEQIIAHGSMRLAAQKLHVTEPTISHQIALLEDELHLPLVLRTRKGVSPTDSGEVILLDVKLILDTIDLLHKHAIALQDDNHQINIAAIPSASLTILPMVIQCFRARYPSVDLQIQESGTYTIISDVRLGTADIGFIATSESLPYKTTDLNVTPLIHGEVVILASGTGSLSNIHELTLAELSREQFIVGMNGYLAKLVLQAMFSEQHLQRPVIYAANGFTTREMIRRNVGIGCIPDFAFRDEDQGAFKTIRISDGTIPITIAVVTSNNVSKQKHVSQFVKICLKCAIDT